MTSLVRSLSTASVPVAHAIDQFIAIERHEFSRTSNMMNSIVVPRPIAFVTTKGSNGVINAAPFSYFNIVSIKPSIISLSIQRRNGERKDTARNIIHSKEFVINICSLDMAKAVSVAGDDFPPEVSEIELTNLSLLPSQKISTPRIANTLVQMECILDQIVEVRKDLIEMILGEVVLVHVHHEIMNNEGDIVVAKLNPLARLAGISYAKINHYRDIPRGITDSDDVPF